MKRRVHALRTYSEVTDIVIDRGDVASNEFCCRSKQQEKQFERAASEAGSGR
jgi:hypothetical protein